jgi:hypothetical protein
MSKKTRRRLEAGLKAKVALEALGNEAFACRGGGALDRNVQPLRYFRAPLHTYSSKRLLGSTASAKAGICTRRHEHVANPLLRIGPAFSP